MTAVWPSLLERFFAKLATERLERAFCRRIKNQKGNFPWRHLASVEVEHVTLGLTPPQFQVLSFSLFLPKKCDFVADLGKV